MFRKTLFFSIILIILPALMYAAVTDYLILQDIGSYNFITQTKNPVTKKIIQIPGYRMWNHPGIISGANHFAFDHVDTTYETEYESDVTDLGVSVQVTQHTGSDSDKWLLHEVEDAYRKNPEQDNFRGTIRGINGNKILTYLKGTHYSWVSNYIVIDIKYTDLQKTKPEPLEIIQAYLQKFPSTITLTDTEVKSRAHNEQWIKDEMERRLWLCDKWFTALQLGKAEIKDVLQQTVGSMTVFLDYREKYFGIKAQDEKNLLAGYLSQNNGTAIKNKLTEYKTWWNVNKANAISL